MRCCRAGMLCSGSSQPNPNLIPDPKKTEGFGSMWLGFRVRVRVRVSVSNLPFAGRFCKGDMGFSCALPDIFNVSLLVIILRMPYYLIATSAIFQLWYRSCVNSDGRFCFARFSQRVFFFFFLLPTSKSNITMLSVSSDTSLVYSDLWSIYRVSLVLFLRAAPGARSTIIDILLHWPSDNVQLVFQSHHSHILINHSWILDIFIAFVIQQICSLPGKFQRWSLVINIYQIRSKFDIQSFPSYC